MYGSLGESQTVALFTQACSKGSDKPALKQSGQNTLKRGAFMEART